MSGMARVHLWSRGAFTSRGAKPNGLEFDAHGLNNNLKGRFNYSGSWVSPFCLYIEIWHTPWCIYHYGVAVLITSDVMYSVPCSLQQLLEGDWVTVEAFTSRHWKVWYMPGDCRSFHQD